MFKQLVNKKPNRVMAIILGLAILISATVLVVNGTLAAPNDKNITIEQPNDYTVIEKNNSRDISGIGIYDYDVSDSGLATAKLTKATGTVTVTGKKAGVVTVSVGSTSGMVLSYNYQIADLNNIGAYTVRDNGEVTFSSPGSTKSVPVTVTQGTNNIKWSSLNSNVASVNSTGVITGNKKGATIILGEFTDKWGVEQDIHILVGVGVNLSGNKLGELIDLINKGEDILGLAPNPYTDETLDDLQNAVDNGKNIINKENPTDEEIQDAIDDLNDAVNNLEQKPILPIESTIVELYVTVNPKITYKVNEYFEPTGMILTALYEDGSRILVDSDYTYSPNKFTTVGDSIPLTITYKGVSTILYVTVKEASALPTDSIPTGVTGRVLSEEKAGDTSTWIEIAQNGSYSLILRSNCIKPNSLFNSTADSHYAGSLLESRMNEFYAQLNVESGLRQYAVTNNATSRIVVGYDATTLTNLNAFSVPSTNKPTTTSGVAFALSYQEYARFCSLKDLQSKATPDTAKANFNKLKQIGDVDLTESMSRSPLGSGYRSFIQLTSIYWCNNKTYDGWFHYDEANYNFDAGVWCHIDYGKGWGVRPAMWVNSDIFE